MLLVRRTLCSSIKIRANDMRLRVNLAILLLAPQGTLAFKQIGPWSDTLTSDAEREIGAKVNGAAASGFLRPEDTGTDVLEAEMQPNATCTAEARLQEMEKELSRLASRNAIMHFFTVLLVFLWPLWIIQECFGAFAHGLSSLY